MTTPASRTAEAAVTSEAGSATVFVDRGNGRQRPQTTPPHGGRPRVHCLVGANQPGTQ